MNREIIIEELKKTGNFRSIPADRTNSKTLDFSANDYLGLAERHDLRKAFLESETVRSSLLLTSSASRLLAAPQNSYSELENRLAKLYGRPALMFNSGYHANSGLIPAITDKDTLILADKLVHASIIDGIMLSKASWQRFRHNDINHLEQIINKVRPDGHNTLVIMESIYSMDGDMAPIEELIALKHRHPKLMLYIDEAHALGVAGDKGLGLALSSSDPQAWDLIIGTLGKAAASVGAYAILSNTLRDIAVNRCRSFIFSTALPPLTAAWSTLMVNQITGMDKEREHLRELSVHLADGLTQITGRKYTPSHIQPVIVGNPQKAVELSKALENDHIKVLPIRTPTVPPGTERLRISLSAAMTIEDIDQLLKSLQHHFHK